MAARGWRKRRRTHKHRAKGARPRRGVSAGCVRMRLSSTPRGARSELGRQIVLDGGGGGRAKSEAKDRRRSRARARQKQGRPWWDQSVLVWCLSSLLVPGGGQIGLGRQLNVIKSREREKGRRAEKSKCCGGWRLAAHRARVSSLAARAPPACPRAAHQASPESWRAPRRSRGPSCAAAWPRGRPGLVCVVCAARPAIAF